MKRILVLTICLWLLSATFAFATPPYPGYGTVVAPPGNSTFAVVRVLAQWVVGGFGYNITSTYEYTHENGCLQVWKQFWRGPVPVGELILIKDFCS